MRTNAIAANTPTTIPAMSPVVSTLADAVADGMEVVGCDIIDIMVVAGSEVVIVEGDSSKIVVAGSETIIVVGDSSKIVGAGSETTIVEGDSSKIVVAGSETIIVEGDSSEVGDTMRLVVIEVEDTTLEGLGEMSSSGISA